MCFISEKSYFSEYGQFIYIENNKSISIKRWNNNGKYIKTMVIPDKINGKPVVSIGKKAFENSYFSELEIPDSVIKIGDEAFSGSELLEKVKLSSNLTKINKELFCSCRINSIVIPDKIKVIKSGALASNPLSEIFIGNNVILKKDLMGGYYRDKSYNHDKKKKKYYRELQVKFNEANFYSMYNRNNRKGGRYIRTETRIKDQFREKVWWVQYIWKYQN
jgi:hypothetical protein